eukprot:s416_g7.t1
MLGFAITWHVIPDTVALFHSSCAYAARGLTTESPNLTCRVGSKKSPILLLLPWLLLRQTFHGSGAAWSEPVSSMAANGAQAWQAALTAATAAAEAATAALAEIKQTKASGLVSKPRDLELTGKPEEDRRIWQDWKFAAIQYLSAKDQKFVENINEVT